MDAAGDKNPFSFSRLHMVHVDDVARAHIFLLEHPNPKGRYNCSPFIATMEEIAQLISSKYPEFQIPTLEELKKNEGPMKLSTFNLQETHGCWIRVQS
ncbi:hypothetical protein SESBI_24537 [Sesbania bispinosa]|nr:hypothetical protein SESBI_24537 [Sesbania bispinosa]